jgi:hypothetical protein
VEILPPPRKTAIDTDALPPNDSLIIRPVNYHLRAILVGIAKKYALSQYVYGIVALSLFGAQLR